MCDKYSFCQNKKGVIFNGYGINSHSAICYIHNLSDDSVNKFEYNPHESTYYGGIYGLSIENKEVFEITKTHLDIIDKHIQELFPTIEHWESFESLKTDENIVQLLKLAKDPSYGVRYAAMRNSSIPIEGLLIGAKYPNCNVRYAAMRNSNMSVEGLLIGAKDPDYDVRCAVMRNSNTSVEGLLIGAKDHNYDVRCAAMNNSNMPIE